MEDGKAEKMKKARVEKLLQPPKDSFRIFLMSIFQYGRME